MEAKIFRQRQRDREQREEESMNEEHQEHQQEFIKAPEQHKPEPPDPLQGLSEEEALSYIASLPAAHTSASTMSSEFHVTLQQKFQMKKAAGEKITPATTEQMIKIKKKVHLWRVKHGLEQFTQEELNEQAQGKEVSSGQ